MASGAYLNSDERLALQVLLSFDRGLLDVGAHTSHVELAAEKLVGHEPEFQGYLCLSKRIRGALRGLTDKGLVTGVKEWWRDPAIRTCLFTMTQDQRDRALLLLHIIWLSPDFGPRLRPSLLAG
jgi:hypothetical protein